MPTYLIDSFLHVIVPTAFWTIAILFFLYIGSPITQYTVVHNKILYGQKRELRELKSAYNELLAKHERQTFLLEYYQYLVVDKEDTGQLRISFPEESEVPDTVKIPVTIDKKDYIQLWDINDWLQYKRGENILIEREVRRNKRTEFDYLWVAPDQINKRTDTVINDLPCEYIPASEYKE